jgi:hypothetical protein
MLQVGTTGIEEEEDERKKERRYVILATQQVLNRTVASSRVGTATP